MASWIFTMVPARSSVLDPDSDTNGRYANGHYLSANVRGLARLQL
jgi:hypothetical protein